jgi:hypothetical protein
MSVNIPEDPSAPKTVALVLAQGLPIQSGFGFLFLPKLSTVPKVSYQLRELGTGTLL